MKILSLKLSTIISILFLTTNLMSQPRMRIQAQKVLHRTTFVLAHAQKELRISRNFTGDFSKAVAHQKLARRLYTKGLYQRSIYHSRFARQLAFRVIKDNKGVEAYRFNKEEEELFKNAPKDEELTEELMKDNSDLKLKDEELLDEIMDGDIYYPKVEVE